MRTLVLALSLLISSIAIANDITILVPPAQAKKLVKLLRKINPSICTSNACSILDYQIMCGSVAEYPNCSIAYPTQNRTVRVSLIHGSTAVKLGNLIAEIKGEKICDDSSGIPLCSVGMADLNCTVQSKAVTCSYVRKDEFAQSH
jgi:hypothetical protein